MNNPIKRTESPFKGDQTEKATLTIGKSDQEAPSSLLARYKTLSKVIQHEAPTFKTYHSTSTIQDQHTTLMELSQALDTDGRFYLRSALTSAALHVGSRDISDQPILPELSIRLQQVHVPLVPYTRAAYFALVSLHALRLARLILSERAVKAKRLWRAKEAKQAKSDRLNGTVERG